MTTPVRSFIDETLARSAFLDTTAPACRAARASARHDLAEAGLPEGKFEHWKYTPIARFYDPAFAEPQSRSAAEIAPPPVDAGDAVDIRYAGTAAEVDAGELPRGLTVTTFAGADETQADIVRTWLNRDIDPERHPLNLVNMTLLEDGLLIHVSADQTIERPVNIAFPVAPVTAICQRVIVVLERNASLQLVEQHDADTPRNLVVECHLADGARLTHDRVQLASAANAWQLTQVNIARDACYDYNGCAFGGAPHRHEIHVRLTGRGGQAHLRGALLSRDRQKLDNQLCIEHIAPDCQSRQQFHGIALDRSELTFNGRIHIHQDAQQSDARLSNRNLLGHDGARVNTKPELEIYADNVQCAHGATVGQLSEAELFYLQSRGIERGAARAMLLRGFIGAVLPAGPAAGIVQRLVDEALKTWNA